MCEQRVVRVAGDACKVQCYLQEELSLQPAFKYREKMRCRLRDGRRTSWGYIIGMVPRPRKEDARVRELHGGETRQSSKHCNTTKHEQMQS
jgi:hypothetical protein